MWFLCFFVWFWVLGYFLLVAWFWDFSISLGLGVGVKFALGRDDIQIRRNVYFMVFWYAVLQFKVSDPGEILDWLQQMDIFIENSLGLSCGFFMSVFFF